MHKQPPSVAFNLVFWLLYFLYEWFGLAALSGQYGRYFINACMALPLAFAVSWITVHLLIKKYYRKGDRLTFWILQLSVALVLLLIRRCINYYLIYPVWFPEAQVVPLFSFGKLIVEWVNLYLITGLYALFYFVRSWYEERQRVQSLLQEKTVAELEGLKAQVQPHFIFNALNNIYATALRASPETARLIGHLSSFLNYNLYEARQEAVPLTAELHYLEHYLELQQNRYGDKLDTSVTVYGETGDLYIAPLLLLPLLENCFKHGIAGSLHPGWIRVEVSRQVDHFSIKLENSVEEGSPEGGARSGGLGLPNVQKRLELLYPGTHQFKTVREPHSYLVVLKINLPK